MRENADQNNSEYELFSRSESCCKSNLEIAVSIFYDKVYMTICYFEQALNLILGKVFLKHMKGMTN